MTASAPALNGMSDLVRRAAAQFGDRIALEMPEAGASFTFRQLAGRVAGIAQFLVENGIGEGDYIAIALPNRPEIPLTTFAASELGAATFAMNPDYSDTELEFFLSKLAPAALLASSGFLGEHSDLLARLGMKLFSVDDAAPNAQLYTVGDADFETLGATQQQAEIVSFGFSSGSTGLPKAIPRTQSQWIRIGELITEKMEITPDDRVITAQPLYYGDPFYCLMSTLHVGATMVMLGKFHSSTFMDLMVEHRATKMLTIGVVPTMIMNTPVKPLEKDLCLTAVWAVGVPKELHAKLERRFGCPWYEVYGTAETATVFMESFDGLDHNPGSGWLGSLAPGVEVRLLTADGTEVTGDGTGILQVRSDLVMHGYHKAQEDTEKVLSADGWYSTGDRVERLDGTYQFLDREKDVVRRSGESISATEVEIALRRNPEILDAAVLPRADTIRGEEVWCFLIPSKASSVGSLETRLDAVLEAAEEFLTRHKVPRFVTVLEEFPRTASQKTIKKELPSLAAGRLYDRTRRSWLDERGTQ